MKNILFPICSTLILVISSTCYSAESNLSIKDFGSEFDKKYSKDVNYPQKFLGRKFVGKGKVEKTENGSSYQITIELPKNSAGDMVLAWCANILAEFPIGRQSGFSGILDSQVYTYDEGGVGIYLKDCAVDSPDNSASHQSSKSVQRHSNSGKATIDMNADHD